MPQVARTAEFEAELTRRTLLSEQRRSLILAWLLTIIALVLLGYRALAGLRREPWPAYWWILLLITLSACAYEWLGARFLDRAVRKGIRPARSRFYINATVEVSVPTAMILVVANYTRPEIAIGGPGSYVFFLLIILSALRLDLPLCVFTGLSAACGLAVVGAIHWSELEAAHGGPDFTARFIFFSRMLLLALGGIIAGLVSRRIRKTLIETMSTIEEGERIKDLFGQHVSPPVANQLLAAPDEDRPTLRDVCVLVFDIRNFTSHSETSTPEATVHLLNRIWGFAVPMVNQHHGIVNKFLGDGFMAVFGAPVAVGNSCVNAVQAAREMLAEVEKLGAAGEIPPIRVGIGLHAGRALVGNVGSPERKEYTVIGDVVNVAFRIERMNKQFGSTLLISDSVRAALAGEAAEPLGILPVRGRREPIAIFRLG